MMGIKEYHDRNNRVSFIVSNMLFICKCSNPCTYKYPGIAESSISDWKRKRTNPVSDKILIICEVPGVTPYELLSGAEHTGSRSRDNNTYVISKGTEIGNLVESYQQLDPDMQKRVLGYLDALKR